jgi:hypothetical protein
MILTIVIMIRNINDVMIFVGIVVVKRVLTTVMTLTVIMQNIAR